MKLKTLLLVSGLGMALTAQAQKEQWLQYNTSREGRGYTWVQASTKAPTNVALPKLTGTAYFGRWKTPLDPTGGRWVCVDQSKKNGPYDRFYVDSNGNGKLDDETPVTPFRSDTYSANFQPAKLTFKGEDGPITYHVAGRFYKYDGSSVNLMLASAGWYGGTVDIGGKKTRIEVIDGNVNGTFNDLGAASDECDRVMVGQTRAEERFLGKLIEVEGKFYRIEVAQDGAFVKLQAAENVSLGKIKVPENLSSFTALGENGHFTRKPVKGEFTMPTGNYRILDWEIKRKDDRNTEWVMSGYGFGEKATFTVVADQPVPVAVGEPVRVTVDFTDRTNQLAFSLKFVGLQQEQVRFTKGGTDPKGPRMTLASADGSYRSTNTFEFG